MSYEENYKLDSGTKVDGYKVGYRQGQLDLIKHLEEWDCQGCRLEMEREGTVCPSCKDWYDELTRLRGELEKDG